VTRRHRGEEGVTALLVALLAVVLVGVLAFVSDLGLAYANQRQVQNGADAAALAVARTMAATAGGSDSCPVVRTAFDTPASRSLAAATFAKNASPSAGLAPGAQGFEVSCDSVGANPEALVVRVRGLQSSPTFFGKIFGSEQVPVDRSARAVVAPLSSAIGLRPFAICKTFSETVQTAAVATFVVPVTQANAGCGAAPGNWAMLDFNGGSNPTGEMQDWIANGFNEPVAVSPPLLVNGDPGFDVNAATAEMDVMFQLPNVVLPVYESVTGTGNSATFSVVGFLAVTPCRWRINNKSGPAESTVNAGCAALPVSPPDDYLQVKYSAYVPVGGLNMACRLGSGACDGPRGTALAD
jgi:Flp pilus assembly protein TadG